MEFTQVEGSHVPVSALIGDGMSGCHQDDDLQKGVAMDTDKDNNAEVENGTSEKGGTSHSTEDGIEQQLFYLTDFKDIKNSDQPKKLELLFHCSTCQKGFATKGGLKFHEKHSHTEGKLFCLVCRKPFKLSNDLERHMNTHTGNRPFKCSECDKSFVCKSSLSQHERLKHIVGDVYKCFICDKTFNTEADHNRHIRVHTGIKPFVCDQCPKSFTCKSSLNVHKRTHAGKTLTCSHCTMQFYIQSDLKRHETTHTGNKPYKCDFCENRYSCKSSYMVHLRNAHSETASGKKLRAKQEKSQSRRKVKVLRRKVNIAVSAERTDSEINSLQDEETLDCSKLQESADDNFKCHEN